MPKQPIGDLIAAVRNDLSAIGNDIAALAKAEIGRDIARIVVMVAAFLMAGFLALMALVLLVVAVAEALAAAGLARWAAFLIDAGICLVVLAALAGLGIILVKRVKGPRRTVTAIKDSLAAIGGKTPEEAAAARAANQTAAQPPA
jgi:ABC-type multidrug transport system fused ATPase/permease subunit